MKWIDTHTHLEHDFPFSVDEYLANAHAAGVGLFVTIGTEAPTLEKLRALAEKYDDVYFTVGVHPHEAVDLNAEAEKKMNELRTHPKCVAVGEIGLDYHYDHSPREVQLKVFERQLELALNWAKPIVIHSREGEDDLLERLKGYCTRITGGRLPGIIHCFSGTQKFAQECLKLGFYLSFSGIVTFKKAEEIRNVVRETPLDKILLETDSPYLAPVPYRGKPNQSAYMIETAKTVATAKGISLDELSTATLANSKKIFGLN